MSKRISHADHTTAALPRAGLYIPMDPASGTTEKFDAGALPALRNASVPGGGVCFASTSGARCKGTLTNQNIGTDPFSEVIKFDVPAAPDTSRGLIVLSPAGAYYAARALTVLFAGSGDLEIQLYGATTADARIASIASFVTTYAGRTVVLAIVRSAKGLKIYVDGRDTSYNEATAGLSPPAWTDTVTSTWLDLGSLGTNDWPFNSTIRSYTLYNLELSQADVTEIFLTGGAVPFRYQFGSQVELITTEADRTFATNSGHYNTGADTSIADGRLKFNGSASYAISNIPLLIGKRYRFGYDLKSFTSGPHLMFTNYSSNQVDLPHTVADGLTYEFTAAATGWAISSNSFGLVAELDNFSMKQLGSCVHLPLDEGYGFLLQDKSSNKLPVVLTTNLLGHLIAKDGPHHIRGKTSTNGNEQAYGQGLIPGNSQITRVRARSQTGTPTITIGNASGGAQIVASVALSTAWADLTIALAGGILAADTSIWVGSNSTDVVEFDLTVEPLSA